VALQLDYFDEKLHHDPLELLLFNSSKTDGSSGI
jgi:hypothetical protein